MRMWITSGSRTRARLCKSWIDRFSRATRGDGRPNGRLHAAGKDQIAEGTPLTLLFPRHPSAVAMLQSLGFMTVDQLAGASASAIEAIGMHGQDYVNYAQQYIAGASSGAAFHKLQFENEEMKRRNDRQTKQIEELTAQIAQINSMMLANASVVPMNRMPPNIPPAEPIAPIAVTMPRAPSFAGSEVMMDVQSTMINQHHPGAASRKHKGGWPKGKKRNPGRGEAA